MNIYVISPYHADTPEGIESNLQQARNICRMLALRGHVPFASHLLYPQFLRDDDEKERSMGMICGRVFMAVCHQAWVYGFSSEGMEIDSADAEVLGLRVKHFDKVHDRTDLDWDVGGGDWVYRCTCGRCQTYVGASYIPMEPEHIEQVGWRKVDGKWLCPLCSGNTANLDRVFGKGEEVDDGEGPPGDPEDPT